MSTIRKRKALRQLSANYTASAVLEACIVAQKASKEDSFITFRIENDILELLFSGIIRNVVDGENGLRPSSETPSCRWKIPLCL
jgi:hypothetical protein